MIQTVRGPISPEESGICLTHEHVLVDCTCYLRKPTDEHESVVASEPVALENLSWIRRNYLCNRDNLLLQDRNLAIRELDIFKRYGGRTIVDVSSNGLGRDPEGLRAVSEETNLHIVMGCGYYVADSHPDDMDLRTVEDIAEEMIRDVRIGVGPSSVKAGIIGELGCSWPLQPNERKVLLAGAMAQQRTGAPITIHTARHPDSPLEIVEVLANAGVDLRRVVMGHLDRTSPDPSRMKALAETGCYLELDMFGRETWPYPHAPMDMITDSARINLMLDLIEDGYAEQVLVSHDVSFKHRLSAFGGSGYGHIQISILPEMRRKGMSEDAMEMILIKNPAQMLMMH
ncbi:MAG: phosphotriesterase [Rhizobiaceae bacterium]